MASGRFLAISLFSLLAFQLHAAADYETALLPPVLVKGEPVRTIPLAERMAELHVPGVSIAYIHNGEIAWTRTYGVTKIGGPAVTPDTLFQAASISKPVTALAVLHLAQEGRLDLDRDVNTYLKSWKLPENDFTAQKKVTLREVLSHTGGLTVHGFLGYGRGTPIPTLTQMLNGEPPANSPPIRVAAAPGSVWKYSGGGYVVIRQLLEDVTNMSFLELMQDLVLGPIGMTHSSYEQPLRPEKLANAAMPYDSDGKEIAGGPHTYPEMAPDGLWTTPSDLARYAIEVQKSLTGNANHVLSESMTREMLKPGLGYWGLGPEVGKEDVPDPLFLHNGGNEGFRCQLIAHRRGDGVVIMTNGDQGGELMEEISRTLAHDQGWPDFGPEEREAVQVDKKVMEHYASYYRMGRYSIVEVSLEHHDLFMTLPGEVKARIYPSSERDWFFTTADAGATFNPDAKGQEPALTLHLSDGDAPARRIDAAHAKQVQDELAAKIKNKTQDPTTEAALRQYIAELQAGGQPDYTQMSVGLANAVKDGLPDLREQMARLGQIKSVTFTGVDEFGGDLYKVVFEHGEVGYHLIVDLRGKTESLGIL